MDEPDGDPQAPEPRPQPRLLAWVVPGLQPRVLAWVVPGLLVVLAAVQIGLSVGFGLTPWKGGGFGMFSTNDHGGFRVVTATAERSAGETRLRIPAALDRERRACRDLPTQGCLESLARALGSLAPDAEAIRVEVWRTEFSADDLAPQRERVASRRGGRDG